MSLFKSTPFQIKGIHRLLVFEVGTKRLATPVDIVRTIADLEESMLVLSSSESEDQGDTRAKINLVDLLSLYFPEEIGNQSSEKKLIVLKSDGTRLSGIIVDRVYGVGSFSDLFPVPDKIFKLPDGVITHIITTEDPWFEVVNLQKIVEINSLQEQRQLNG